MQAAASSPSRALPMISRERRTWTAQEDDMLRAAVNLEEPGNPAPSKWHAIAKHVPNRTNKDCRKRWYAKMNADVVKGGWAPDEDQRLLSAIDRFGTKWALVASVVQTRNSDQCAKRWCDTLNPAIDRTAWSSEADELLIQAVNEHGKVWTKIVQMYFPGRTGLAAKNRYNSITRSEGSSSRGSSQRRDTPDPSFPDLSSNNLSNSSLLELPDLYSLDPLPNQVGGNRFSGQSLHRRGLSDPSIRYDPSMMQFQLPPTTHQPASYPSFPHFRQYPNQGNMRQSYSSQSSHTSVFSQRAASQAGYPQQQMHYSGSTPNPEYTSPPSMKYSLSYPPGPGAQSSNRLQPSNQMNWMPY
ncbi:hypothetical protein C8J57DRAFT_1348488 [Mycena rebaudengoi]|nr:hypothetical protein C8J57DRAFT_1348488 [Mycena rebaudengoi]